MVKKNFIISIIIIATVIGGYFWFKNGGQNIISESSPNYTNSTYGFSLSLPEGMQASSFAEGEGEITLVNGQNFSMQIYVSPFDEDIVLTSERIKKDLPDMTMESVGSIKVGDIPAVSFISTNEQNQKTKEVWFVKEGNLYQISALVENESKLNEIIKSWQ